MYVVRWKKQWSNVSGEPKWGKVIWLYQKIAFGQESELVNANHICKGT